MSNGSRLRDRLLSTDRQQRLRITRSLLAAGVFMACIGLQAYACWAGYMQTQDMVVLSGVIVLNVLFWYAMLRSGLNRLFVDPALTLPQILSALTIIVGAYSVTGAIHGATMSLLALVLVFGIFNMKAAGARIAGGYSVLAMGLAIAIKVQTDPQHYPLKLEAAHFMLVVAIVPTISVLAAQLSGMRGKLQRQKDELALALKRIQILATRDELTGLLNRRHMHEVLQQHQKRLHRSGHHDFCVAMLDIDHFKRINDTHGHGKGDEVLQQFAQVAQTALRETDVLARWGGEEFLMLIADASPDQAQGAVTRIREALSQSGLLIAEQSPSVRFSAGLTGYAETESLDACIERADRALYEAKSRGRDCTVVSPRPTPTLREASDLDQAKVT